MAHSFSCNWFHLIWRTKRSFPHITRRLASELYPHMIAYARKSGYHIDSLGGSEDHVHALVELRNDQHPTALMQAIKGESAHWINFHSLTRKSFVWQPGFASFTVSKWVVPRIRAYIRGQLERHAQLSFLELMERIVMLHSRPPDEGSPGPP
jgi:REP element-mobilizing transposase RayT